MSRIPMNADGPAATPAAAPLSPFASGCEASHSRPSTLLTRETTSLKSFP